ncbi:15297_t:CDS:2 [Funneliformis geosporum]|uniref:Protein AF-9 homolog n=1 Tax=Funneliformis geosporum TaxID=1117311 RepID=A0A9W4ST55_9GLOM|nr:15297_t:CDS:2 [Funneliformis geosporum]CAI2180594.1 12499_t:CDS:2 [Funneliformis geosporum]
MSNKRTKGVTVIRPIVYGNIATLLPQKKIPDSDHTHKWTVSVKGLNNEDISSFVKKVTFKLHETYANPQRVVEHPPFELTETGWGEFELTIKLQFVPESGEKPVMLYHNLRLHPYEEDGSISTANKNKPVFTDPTEYLYQIFLQNPSTGLQPRSTPNNPYSVQAEIDEIRKIEEATKKVQEQLVIYKDKLEKTTKELDEVKVELERVKK